MTYIIRTHKLTKAYKGVEVVSDVNMNVKKGEIYGFLGPNGAGKTTVMKMLTNLVTPTGGEIEVLGKKLIPSSFEVLKRMGSIIEYPIFYEKLSARKNLELHCEYMGYYNKSAISEALNLVNLVNIENQPVKEFSLGMKQRLAIARAIITKPDLLILDEPVNGLDPLGIRELRDLFITLSSQYGMTILISSHILGEIEQIADTIGVIRKGKLLEEASMDIIRNKHVEHLELSVKEQTKAAFVLENELNIDNFRIKEQDGLIHIYDNNISQNDIIQAMVTQQIEIGSITKKSKSLEDYFLQLIEGGNQHA
ncbi:ABC transporter ATP-binding protein [Aquibacillus rhizosphaerae]|uniref:ABC transporter ATP-binding protein n=1 Tax=Aquibacillus rhizosphaerae TaxID=3051431 RepID=A0ABT7L3R2_9BACI|nr:ABC transporter ATP-binding protein [Aquibacillus sp. LR5S19]MDL4839842.1 ABC transporter ATP-binding protein [Aquibacillus sp. LR5S19]